MKQEDRPQNIARICKVLSVDKRVLILQLLSQRRFCVGALSKNLNITDGAVSQHLRILRDVGLVEAHRCGSFVHYEINRAVLEGWRTEIERLLGGIAVECRNTCTEEKGKLCVESRNAVIPKN